MVKDFLKSSVGTILDINLTGITQEMAGGMPKFGGLTQDILGLGLIKRTGERFKLFR